MCWETLGGCMPISVILIPGSIKLVASWGRWGQNFVGMGWCGRKGYKGLVGLGRTGCIDCDS